MRFDFPRDVFSSRMNHSLTRDVPLGSSATNIGTQVMFGVAPEFYLSPAVNKESVRIDRALLDTTGKTVVFRKRTLVASRCQNIRGCSLAGDNATQKTKALETARML